MGDASMIDAGRHGRAHEVAVQRPLHIGSPGRRFRKRWRARSDRRRAARAERKKHGEASRWWDAFDFPFGDLDGGPAVILAVIAAILLVVILVFAAPFLWIAALFVAELLVWLLVAIVGLAAWLLLGRPWRVVVTDRDDNVVASVPVRGRRRAREHAAVVEQRLASGADPTMAIALTAH